MSSGDDPQVGVEGEFGAVSTSTRWSTVCFEWMPGVDVEVDGVWHQWQCRSGLVVTSWLRW